MHERSFRLLLTAATGFALAACTSSRSPAGAAPDDAGADGGAACTGSGVQKGPFVASTSATTVTVRWESCRAGAPRGLKVLTGAASRMVFGDASEFVLTKDHEAVLTPKAAKDLAGPVWTHEVVVDGLAPGTCGSYELEADASKKGAFCTFRPPTQELRFVAIGDTNPGLLRTGPLLAFATAGNAFAEGQQRGEAFRPDFVFHLGDIQYYDSRLETWASWFPMMQPLLALGGFFAVLGNHEFENATDYPEFYERLFGRKGWPGTDRWHTFESAGIAFVVLDTESAMDEASEQGQWLARTLAGLEARKGRDDYRGALVGFHKPWLTCGDTGDNPELLARWEPRFVAAGVVAVLAGHMHGYERFDHGGRPWVVTGGGGGAIREPNKNMARAYCNERTKGGAYYHLMRVRSEGAKLHFDAVDDTGAVFDAFDAPLLRGTVTR